MSERREHGLRIGIDARAASHPQAGGYKTYTRGLLHALGAEERRVEITAYVDRSAPDLQPLAPHIASWRVVNGRVPTIGPVWREQVGLGLVTRRDEIDLLHSPASTGPVIASKPMVVTIHDAIEHMPRQLTGAVVGGSPKRALMAAYNRSIQRFLCRRAAMIVTVSQCSARDLTTYLGVPPGRIRVVEQAPSPTYRPPDQIDSRLASSGSFILAIGSADPRKNLAALFRAYATLPSALRKRFPLVCVWTHDALRSQLGQLASALKILDDVRTVSAPTDRDLRDLYHAAAVFVFPSLYEGFGLPPLEAMASGTPVIASNAGALPESLGDAAVFIDPTSPPSLAAALTSVLEQPSFRKELSERGLQRAARFSWVRAADQLIEIYHEAAGGDLT